MEQKKNKNYFLLTYNVENSQNFMRDHFDGKTIDGLIKDLAKLRPDEYHIYDCSRTDWSSRFLNIADFVMDCNDQEINLEGLWMDIFTYDENLNFDTFMQQLIDCETENK